MKPEPETQLEDQFVFKLDRVDRMHWWKDTGVFDDDVSCSLVEHHLIEDVDNLTHKLIILLFS